jgi:hypothetical protein
LLVFGPSATAWVTSTPGRSGGARSDRISVAGWLQGAALEHGKGRVYVSGEAAMFSAQRSGTEPMGMNHPAAAHNARFLWQIARWLAR